MSVDELASIGFNVLDNDLDADLPGETLTVSEVGGDSGNVGSPIDLLSAGEVVGTLTINSDGSASFDATADIEVEQFEVTQTYAVTDGTVTDEDVQVVITINPYNDNEPELTAGGLALEAAGLSFDEDQYGEFSPFFIVLNPLFSDLDIDSDGILDSSTGDDNDSLDFGVVSNSNGILVTTSITDGDMKIYTSPHEHGTAEIVVAATDVADPAGNITSAELTFTITVDSVNDGPIYTLASYDDIDRDEDEDEGGTPCDPCSIVIDLDGAFSDADIDSDSDGTDDSLTYTLTIVDAPNEFVATGMFDEAGLTVLSESLDDPAVGSRTIVLETTDDTITLPVPTDASGTMDITVRATDLGLPEIVPLFDEEMFSVTINAVADDSPIAADDHYSDFPDDLVMDEDGDPITFDVVNNDYLGDAPSLVISAGALVEDSFGADHAWRTGSRMADPNNTGDFIIEINGEVSCAADGCQDDQTPDTIVSGSELVSTQIIYRPRLNFNGEDVFTYCIEDAFPGGEDPFTPPVDPRCAEVTVMVNAVNDLPEPDDPVLFTMDQAEDLIVDVASGLRSKVVDVDNTHMDGLGCDPLDPDCSPDPSDPQPDTLYFFITSATTEFGELLAPFTTDGAFQYRPDATFSGEDFFVFDVCEVPVPNVDNCVFGVTATIVVEAIEGAPDGSSEDIVEFDFDLADIPLELPVGPEANVLVVNDDSGSMAWDILTDQESGLYYFSTGNYLYYTMKATAGSSTYVAPGEEDTPNSGLWRLRNSDFNTIYYNPTVRYDPWDGQNNDGDSYPDSDPTSARHDPLVSSPTTNLRLPQDYTGRAVVVGEEVCEDVCVKWKWFSCQAYEEVCSTSSGFQQVSVEDLYLPRYYTWDDKNDNGTLDATPSPILDADNSEGALTEIRPASEGGSDTYPKPEGRTDCITNELTCTYVEELQNFANWFTYSRNREFTAKSALGKVVAEAENIRIGYAKINSSSNTVPIETMNVSENTGAKANLLDAIYLTGASGGTPLRRALRDAGRHFECRSGDIFNSGSNSTPGDDECPVFDSPFGNCQQNFTLLISDGAWNGGTPSLGDTDDDDSSNFDEGVYAGSETNTLADVAMHYYERDLHTLANEVPTSSRDRDGASETAFEDDGDEFMHQHMKTYTIGFGVNGLVDDDDVPTDYTESFTWGNPTTTERKIDDMRHAAVNGRGDYLSAGNAASLAEALDQAFAEFQQGSGTASAVSFNSQEILEDTLVFRTFYNTKTNTGDLVAQPITDAGAVGDPVWNSAARLDLVTYDDREIFTFDRDSASDTYTDGIPFRPSTLNDDQKAVFIDDPGASDAQKNLEVTQRVNYLRGQTDNERPDGNFRERPATEGKLGDVVHSQPTFIGPPSRLGRDAEPFPQDDLYSAFKGANENRDTVVYVAANDGMMHAFDATNGDEKFAYVPNNLMTATYSRKIVELLDYEYTHRYFVDLSPAINDVYIDSDGDGDKEWITMLVGGHGGGAKAYFALNISDPGSVTEATAGDVVMWEFTDEDDTYPTEGSNSIGGVPFSPQRQDLLDPAQPVKDLGYTFSVPTLVMSNLVDADDEQKWVSISGNGYNGTSGIAKLLILFLDGGVDGQWCHPDRAHDVTVSGTLPAECIGKQDFVKLDTTFGVSGGFPNGLGEPRAIDVDANGTADYVYAGDMLGNLFRFDITSDDYDDWNVTKIFEAKYIDEDTMAETIQPITTQPIAIIHPTEEDGFIVIFATGAYMRTGDSVDPSIHSIYGIWDRLGPTLIDKELDLVEQEFTNLVDDFGRVRTLSVEAVDYSVVGGKKGWYIDLDMPAAGDDGGAPEFPGEKAVRNIQLRGGLAFVNSIFPREANSCVGDAGGATLAFCPDTGGSECVGNRTIFDLNNDGAFDALDDVGPDDNPQTAMGRILEDPAPPTDSTFIGDKRVTQFGRELDIIGTNTSMGSNTGRLSWKRLDSVN